MNRDDLEAQLGSTDPEMRRRGAARLGASVVENPVPLLVRALGDDDWRVRKEATAAAIAMAPSDEVLRALVGAFQPSENVGLRNAAVECLAGFGQLAVEALSQALDVLDADGRKLAAEALAQTGQAGALEPLRRLLDDPDPNVRVAAIEAIAGIGSTCFDAAVPLLEQCLSHVDRLVRLAALDGMNRLGVSLPWERLEALIGDPILARPALLAAGRSENPSALPRLARTLNQSSGMAWFAALCALAGVIRSGGPLLEPATRAASGLTDGARSRLLALASSASEPVEVRRDALTVLGALGGDDVARAAVTALSDDRVAADGEAALTMLGSAAVPVLAEQAAKGGAEERATCVELVGRLADASCAALANTAINRALGDESPDVVRAALVAVARVGAPDFLPVVVGFLEGEPGVRKAAETALAALCQRHTEHAKAFARNASADGVAGHASALIMATLGSVRDDPVADIDFLSGVLASDSAAARRAAVEALAMIGTPHAVDAVAFAISDEEREVRLAGIRALGRMRKQDGSVAGLEQLLEIVERSQDQALVAAATRALGDTGDARAVDVLRRLARSGAAVSAVAAVEALGQLPSAWRIEGLIDALAHPEAEVVKAALPVLAAEDDPRVLIHLGACLDHEAWDVRRIAADLLAQSGGPGAVGLLRTKIGTELEPLVREALMRALAELESATGLRRGTSSPPPRRGSRPPR